MKIGQYCQRQRCKHVESEQFWHAFASRGFVSDSWAFLFYTFMSKGVIVTKNDISQKYLHVGQQLRSGDGSVG